MIPETFLKGSYFDTREVTNRNANEHQVCTIPIHLLIIEKLNGTRYFLIEVTPVNKSLYRKKPKMYSFCILDFYRFQLSEL